MTSPLLDKLQEEYKESIRVSKKRAALGHLPHTQMRWTGDKPDPAFVLRLAVASRDAINGNRQAKNALSRLVYGDVTGWAQTRYHLEEEMDASRCPTRSRRLWALAQHVPPWGFEPNPTGWSKDGWPKDFA